MRLTTAERFWSRVEKTDDCWLWTGGLDNGYGRFYLGAGKWARAHRWAWEETHGSLPPGDHLHHTCEVIRCVRPDHLELLDPSTHARHHSTLGGRQAAKTHCPQGHAYTPENTATGRRGDGSTFRVCRTCQREDTWRRRGEEKITHRGPRRRPLTPE